MQVPGWSLVAQFERLPWRDTQDPGVQWLPLRLEQQQSTGAKRGGSAVLIRLEPGRGYVRHRHLGPEDVLVLQGGYRDERGAYTAGATVHYPADTSHGPVALGDATRPEGPDNPACVLYAVVENGIEVLRDPAGDAP